MVKILLVKVAKIILSALVEHVLQQHASPNRSRNDMDHHANQKNPNNPAYYRGPKQPRQSNESQQSDLPQVTGQQTAVKLKPAFRRPVTERKADPWNSTSTKKPTPAYLADADPNRALLDRRVICDLLGFNEDIYQAVRRLSAKWCAEPSVHGGKKRPKGARLTV